MLPLVIISVAALLLLIAAFVHHQRLLSDRAYMMLEAIRNRDFQFRLPTRGLFFGERALQQALNEMGTEINRLMAQSEVESWQKMTRVLTHEIMNATAPIQSISQSYLAHPAIQGTALEEGIRAIHDTSLGLAIFVQNYHSFTHLQKPVMRPIALQEFAEQFARLYPDLQWSIQVSPHAELVADEGLLRQVLINLTKNAQEARARRMDIRWTHGLFVSNDGQPIPAEVQEQIFIPFFSTKRSGSGIGLSLSRQLLMQQGLRLSLLPHPLLGFTVSFAIER